MSTLQTILEIPVRDGTEEALVEFFRTEAVFEQAGRDAGFLGARLLLPEMPGERLVVVAEWADAAAIQRWIDDPARSRLDEPLGRFLAGEPVRKRYAIALAWP